MHHVEHSHRKFQRDTHRWAKLPVSFWPSPQNVADLHLAYFSCSSIMLAILYIILQPKQGPSLCTSSQRFPNTTPVKNAVRCGMESCPDYLYLCMDIDWSIRMCLLGLVARVMMMFWTKVAPELMLAWVVRPRIAVIRDIYNQHMGAWIIFLH